MTGSNHALVMGASGLIGWGVVNELLSADGIAPSAFKRVTALVNRSIDKQQMYWPVVHPTQPHFLLVDGVNLMEGEQKTTELLREKVPDAETITHAFYFVFRADDVAQREVTSNIAMLKTFLNSVECLTSNLKFLVFPGGTRGYGIYRPGGIFASPLEETLVDQLPKDYAQTVAYPSFRRLLTAASQDKQWTWCELCPDAVVGFAPNGSGWSLAAHWAVFLSAWRLVHGEGAEVPFPGTLAGYESRFTEVSTRILARVAIHAAVVETQRCGGGKIFNVADCETPGSMCERWPMIAAWFGLRGVPPPPGGYRGDKPSEFIAAHKNLLDSTGVKKASVWHTNQLDSYGYWLNFDRYLSLRRLREEAGFSEEARPEQGWYRAFDMFKKAGMIP